MLKEAVATYNPIYKATRVPYGKTVMPATITVYGAIGSRTYRGMTGKEAMKAYREEWEALEAEQFEREANPDYIPSALLI